MGPDGVIAWTVASAWSAMIIALVSGANDSEPCATTTGLQRLSKPKSI